jgi:WD40 repeat protein
VVTAGDALKIWSPDGELLRRREIPGGNQTISPDGRFVASSADRIDVWNVADGTRRIIGSHPGGDVKALAFAPDNSTLASAAGGDQQIRIWDLRTAPPVRLPGKFAASELLFSPRGDRVAAVQYAQGAVAIWPRAGGPPRVHEGVAYMRVMAAAFSRDGRAILAAGDDGRLWRTDLATGERSVARELGPTHVAAFSPDGAWLATGSDVGPLRLWAVSGGPPVTLAPRVPRSASLVVGNDGRVAMPNAGPRVQVWDRRGRRIQLTAPAPVVRAAFSPSGESLAASSTETASSVYLWRELGSGGSRPVLLAQSSHPVRDLAFAPDGSGVAGAIEGAPPELWGIDDGSRISLTEDAVAVVQGPGGLWNVNDGGLRTTLPAGAGAELIAFDPAGTAIALGAVAPGTVHVLECKACGTARRVVAEARRLVRRGGVN